MKLTGKHVSWSVFERKDALGQMYAMSYFFGLPCYFITISPRLKHYKLAVRLTISDKDGRLVSEDEILSKMHVRGSRLIENPVAATDFFYRIITNFFKIIVKLAPTEFTVSRKFKYPPDF